MKTIEELLEPIGIRLIVCVDTYDFQKFYESHGSPDGDFHKVIWRTFMCDHFANGGSYICFSREINPKNLLDEWVNKFLDAYPEFGDEVKFMFTN